MITKPPLSIVRFSRAALVLLFVAWAPAGVAAVTATLTAGLHLRAGPDIVYPSVMMLPPGAVVQVFGCEQAYNWCDVQMGADRGWVDAAYLQAPAPSGAVVIASSPAVVGVPIVTFSFNNYWNTYYVGRPWYGRRATYYNYWNRYPHGRPPPIYRPRPPPRPPPGTRPPSGGRPPGGKPPSGNRPPPSTRPAPSSGQ
jgi:uncharacterized protein YraI